MIFKIDFFQFSNNNPEKDVNSPYYNNIKGKMHKFEKIWWSFYKVWLRNLLNSSPKLWFIPIFQKKALK